MKSKKFMKDIDEIHDEKLGDQGLFIRVAR